jgi:tetratricopeptide (TPR) repeat protein
MISIQKVLTGLWMIMLVLGLNTLNAQDIDEARAAYNEGVELVNQDQLPAALEKFENCIEICEMLEDEEAIEIKESVTNIIPGLQFKIAGKQLQDGDFKAGIEALEKTIEFSKEYGDNVTQQKAEGQLTKVYLAYAKNLLKNEDYTGANSYFDKALAVDPNDASVYLLKGYMYRQQDNPEMVKENLLKAVEVANQTNDRKTASAAIDQGWKYFYKRAADALGENNFGATIENTRSALEFNPSQPDVLFLLVQSLNKDAKYDEAIESAKKALDVIGSEEKKAGVYFEMAQAHQAQGNNDAACENYKNAMVGQYVDNAKYQVEHILKCGE